MKLIVMEHWNTQSY